MVGEAIAWAAAGDEPGASGAGDLAEAGRSVTVDPATAGFSSLLASLADWGRPPVGERADKAPLLAGERADKAPPLAGERADKAPLLAGERADKAPLLAGERFEDTASERGGELRAATPLRNATDPRRTRRGTGAGGVM